MIIKHKELVEKGKKILLDKGFKKNEIFTEYSIKLKNGLNKILDIVGVNEDRIIGIECGSLGIEHEMIKEVVDEFILLPYVKKKGNPFHCSNCNHSWNSRVEKPVACPKCKRYFVLNYTKNDYWNKIK